MSTIKNCGFRIADCGLKSIQLRIVMALVVMALGAQGAWAALNLKAEAMGGSAMGASMRSPFRYVRLSVENPNAHKVTYDLAILSYPTQGKRAINGQALEAGERRVYHLPLLDGQVYNTNISCSDSDGQRATAGVNFSESKAFLHIAPVAGWASEKAMQDFSRMLTLSEGGTFGDLVGSSRMTAGSGGSTANFVTQADPAELPDNWVCYSPFVAVIVSDEAFKQMPVESRTALTRWVEAGGALTIYGSAEPGLEQRLLGKIRRQAKNPIEELAAMVVKIESEALARTSGNGVYTGDHWRAELSGGKLARIDFGAAPSPTPKEWLGGAQPWQRFWGGGGEEFPYPLTTSQAGTIGGLALATIFCIVAGPMNYAYWRRRNKIHMLMISLPALSIGFCLLITVYFVASRGFTRKGGTFSVSVLDEASNSQVTFSRHLILSGLFPLGGFSFDREAAFYPLQQPNDRAAFQMDLTKGQRLTSGLFIPSVPFHYFTAMPGTTRERLVVDEAAKSVTNGFEAPLEGVVVVHGKKVYSAGKIAPGGRAALAELSDEEAGRVWTRHLDERESDYIQRADYLYKPVTEAPGGYYAVVFSEGQATEQPGVRIKSGKERHVLFGTLGAQKAEAAPGAAGAPGAK